MQTTEKLRAQWEMLHAKAKAEHEALKRKIAENTRRKNGQALLSKINKTKT